MHSCLMMVHVLAFTYISNQTTEMTVRCLGKKRGDRLLRVPEGFLLQTPGIHMIFVPFELCFAVGNLMVEGGRGLCCRAEWL